MIAAAAQSLFITLIPSIYVRSCGAEIPPPAENLGGADDPPKSSSDRQAGLDG